MGVRRIMDKVETTTCCIAVFLKVSSGRRATFEIPTSSNRHCTTIIFKAAIGNEVSIHLRNTIAISTNKCKIINRVVALPVEAELDFCNSGSVKALIASNGNPNSGPVVIDRLFMAPRTHFRTIFVNKSNFYRCRFRIHHILNGEC